MRSAASLAAVTCLAALAAAAAEAPPPVSRVVLHPDGAVVVRTVDAACVGGAAVAKFPGLPPGFDPSTLRAAVTPATARVQGVGVSERVQAEPFDDEVRALDRQLEALDAEAALLTREAESAAAADERAEALRNTALPFLAREVASSPKPDVAAWTTALETLRRQVESAGARRRATTRAAKELAEKREELQARRDRLAGASPTRVVDADVAIACSGSGSVKAELSYTTPWAGWRPAYEARADEAGGKVAFTVAATAQQQTGETWRGVEVLLSTALANRDAEPPVLQRLYVGAYEQQERRKVLVQRQEAAEHLADASTETTRQGDDAFSAEDQGLSVQMKVPGRVDLAGDGRPARMAVETLSLPGRFGLLTIPKLQPFAFRSTEVTNAARYPLLPGPAELFTSGGFIGTAPLPRTDRNERVRLSFGVDEAVQIRRVVLAEDKLEPGFLQSSKRLVYGYRIELESSSKAPVTLTVQEPVPVSEVSDVKVTLEKATTPGYALAAADGRVEWVVPLKPGERRTLELHFTVEVPSRYDATGL